MNILVGTLMIWAAALAALAHLRRSAPGRLPELRIRCVEMGLFLLPRLAVGLIGAGFLAALLPPGLVAARLGDDSGLGGVALAALAGAATPGGPLVAFALAAAGLKAGAGYGALAAYVTGWSVFAMSRTLAYEIALMGGRFTRLRLLVSWPLPLILGAAVFASGLG